MFERMVHDTRGISIAGFNKLCQRTQPRLFLLAPGWDSEKDWRLLLDLSGLEERADDVDLTISWAEFERWYTLQGFPERNETDVRKRLYKDIKSKVKVNINAVEASKQQGTSSPQNIC